MFYVKQPLALVTAAIWAGFILAISFMEAWLKFQAPGITIPLGLGIGRLVFFALNKVELLCFFIVTVSFILNNKKGTAGLSMIIGLAVILLVQTVYMLPVLDARAGLWLKGTPPPPSNLHVFYIISEAIKLTCIFRYIAWLLGPRIKQ